MSDQQQGVELSFSNTHLLKFECHDKYAACNAIKKVITSKYPKANADAPLLPGLVRIGKAPKSSSVYLSFSTKEDQESAAEKCAVLAYRGKKWERKEVTQADLDVTHGGGSQMGKRKRENGEGNTNKNKKGEEGVSVAPWMEVPYVEQINRKTEHCIGVMHQICREQKAYRQDNAYLKDFDGVHPSELRTEYRNHVNFSCGYDSRGNPCLGFMEGSMVEGYAALLPASDPSILATTHSIAQFFALKIQNIAVFRFPLLRMMDKRRASSGFWRRVQVRHNVDQEVMIDLELDTKIVSASVLNDVLSALKELAGEEVTKQAQEAVPGGPWRLASLQYHSGHGTNSVPDSERHVICGAPTIRETVCGMKFDVSPTAFFQVNTKGMEKMMSLVGSCCNLTKNTILLDLCCGTGTIGLCFANEVKKIIGIEMVVDAVENAKVNAAMNNLTNVEYHAKKLEDSIHGVLRSINDFHNAERDGPLHVVGILDPPRCGLHPSVTKTLRNVPGIDEFVYISCDQKALVVDAQNFTKDASNAFYGEKFKVVRAFGVDLFPQSHHVEFVAVFKRAEALKAHIANPPPSIKADVATATGTESAAQVPASEE